MELEEWEAPPALPPRRNIYLTGTNSEDESEEAAARQQRADERFHRALYHETIIPFPWRQDDRGDGFVYLDHLEALDAAAVAAQERRARWRQQRAARERQQRALLCELSTVFARREEAGRVQDSMPMGAEARDWPMADGARALPRTRTVRFNLQQLDKEGAASPMLERTTTQAEIHPPPTYGAAMAYKQQRGGIW